MLSTRIIPVLLLKGGGLVKTIKFKNPVYIGDPINAVKIFNEKEVDELIFLDIEAAKSAKPVDYKKISEITNECFMPLCYGGGLNSVDQMKKIFSLGAEKAAINSFTFKNPGLIKDAALVFGSQSVVVSIDAKKNFLGKYEVMARGGLERTGKEAVEWARECARLGAGEILLNSIDRDGTMVGYDIELINKVSGSVSIPVIACGGAGKYSDFAAALAAGASALAAGSLFVFYGKNRAVLINYPARSGFEMNGVNADK
ncbi:MAG: AglZ/HisF2 family acetamidino modification protein [Minisyncoccales bacterium]